MKTKKTICCLVMFTMVLMQTNSYAQVRKQVGQASCGIASDMVSQNAYIGLYLRKGKVYGAGTNYNLQFGNGTDWSVPDQHIPELVSNLDSVISVSAGVGHCLALKSDGTVWAWGGNGFGACGTGLFDNNNLNYKVPVKVAKLENVIAISAGFNYSLALKSDGTVWTWGINDFGQLGLGYSNGLWDMVITPTQIPYLTNVKAIATSQVTIAPYLFNDNYGNEPYYYDTSGTWSMALKADGTVWAWGENRAGQLGIGNNISSTKPVQCSGLKNITGIAAGGLHGLALDADGTVWSWGRNAVGQLGNYILDNRNEAKKVLDEFGNGNPLKNIASITACNLESFFLKSDGTILSCGWNNFGQCGIGNLVNRITKPSKVVRDDINTPLDSVVAVKSGYSSTMAILSSGRIYMWAWGTNQWGQFGNGSYFMDPNVPGSGTKYAYAQYMQSLTITPISIAAGNFHSMALTLDGSVYTWGSNEFGQLGIGTSGSATNSTILVKVKSAAPNTFLGNMAAIAGGASHSLALNSKGDVFTWGNNNSGQLGNGNNINSTLPGQIKKIMDVVAIAAPTVVNGDHSMALKVDGTVWSWGNNNTGQLGDGTGGTLADNKSSPVLVLGLDNVIAIAAGRNFSMALKANGTVWAWGTNKHGELGDGSSGSSVLTKTPVQVSSLTNIVAIAAGGSHALALGSDGYVWAWGSNESGELGTGDNILNPSPGAVKLALLNNKVPFFLKGVKAIGAGNGLEYGENSSALLANGNLLSWGSNVTYQLGIGTASNTPHYFPIKATSIGSIKHISNITFHAMIIHADGSICVAGNNSAGQLGNGTNLTDGYYDCTVGHPIHPSSGKENNHSVNSEPNNHALEVMHIYPNPAKNQFRMVLPGENNTVASVSIFTLTGVNVKQFKDVNCNGNCEKVFDVSTLQTGNYFVKISTNQGVYIEKLCVVK